MPQDTAERMRKARQRRKDGLRIIPVEIGDDEILALVKGGLLDPRYRADRHAIGRAVGSLLDAVPLDRWVKEAAG